MYIRIRGTVQNYIKTGRDSQKFTYVYGKEWATKIQKKQTWQVEQIIQMSGRNNSK